MYLRKVNSNIKTECFDYKHNEKGGRYERQRFKQNFLKQSNYNIMLITENKALKKNYVEQEMLLLLMSSDKRDFEVTMSDTRTHTVLVVCPQHQLFHYIHTLLLVCTVS